MHPTYIPHPRITKEGLSPKIKTFSSFVVSTSSSSRKIIVLRKCSFCSSSFSLDDTTMHAATWTRNNETAVATQKALKSPQWRHNSKVYVLPLRWLKLLSLFRSSCSFSHFPLSYLLIDLALSFYCLDHVIISAAVQVVTCFIDSFGVKDKKHSFGFKLWSPNFDH